MHGPIQKFSYTEAIRVLDGNESDYFDLCVRVESECVFSYDFVKRSVYGPIEKFREHVRETDGIANRRDRVLVMNDMAMAMYEKLVTFDVRLTCEIDGALIEVAHLYPRYERPVPVMAI